MSRAADGLQDDTMPIPARPKIYHIVHVDNLPSIVADGGLFADAIMVNRPGGTVIGMGSIKRRRLTLPVGCHPKTHVGDYVPFYFCSRSVMLYVIHCANHAELAYQGGQQPIVHLEADLLRTVEWAAIKHRRWAFTLSNAGAIYTQFRADIEKLGDVNWDAVAAIDFRSSDIKEGKQAEFLLEHSFPWQLVDRIGVHSQSVVSRVSTSMERAAHRPVIEIRRDWYY